MSEEDIVSQMRTVISAGYETVSAIIAVSPNTNRSVNQTRCSCSLIPVGIIRTSG